MPATVQRQLEKAFGVPLLLSYGMTETGNIAQSPPPPQRTPVGSVGRAGLAEVAVVDETGRVLGPDEQGEILVRGPEVFSGYEDDAEANRRAFRDGWFSTGDLGRIDRDGFVFLEGRIKDLVNRGGAKISPQEVEAVLTQHADVSEAAAFGMRHPTLGEDVAAAVVLRTAASVTMNELRRHARGRLAAYKVPARIIELTQLPRSAHGKVDRRALADLVARLEAVDFEPPRDQVEIDIARIFAEVLDVSKVSRSDSFFDLGGDSLRAVRVLARIEEDVGVAASLELLLDHPTAAEFATEIRNLKRRQCESVRPGGFC
jgi:acyl-CoA synthetase (AMP-forming)/AMP-acid ligase II/acyl carrier protein